MREIKADAFLIFAEARPVLPALRQTICEGGRHFDDSGDFDLKTTIAALLCVDAADLRSFAGADHFTQFSHAEMFMQGIHRGDDYPNPIKEIVLEWIDEFAALMGVDVSPPAPSRAAPKKATSKARAQREGVPA